MVLGRRLQRRLVIAGLAATFAVPAFVIAPASAAILFTCDSVAGSATLSPGLVHSQRAEGFSSGPTAPAGPADITLASTSDTGVKSSGGTSVPDAMSADGRRVAIVTRATELDPADTDNFFDVYVKDLTTGDITLATTSDTGVKANNDSGIASLSGDGTKIAFHTPANNLDPADTDTTYDVYVKDVTTGDITLASTSDTGVKGNGHSSAASLSYAGTKVAFASSASNFDPAGGGFAQIYVKDLTTGDITLVSTSDSGVKGNDNSGAPSLSYDGTKVAFDSDATNLDPADADIDADVYVKDLTTGDITLASTSDAGVNGNGFNDESTLAGDGSRVVFLSSATNLDPADANSEDDVYVKELATGDITLASTSDTGVKGNDVVLWPTLSGDGSRVAWNTNATNLDPADSDSDPDVYVKDLATGNITLASTSDTGARGAAADFHPRLSDNGTTVAFWSWATDLDPADTSSDQDIYVKELPTVPTSISIGDCSNGQSGAVSVVELRSYGARPLGCPASLGGALGNDYPDQTPVLLGLNPSLRIDWATGPDSVGVAKLKMGTTPTQWRAVLAIQASPGHNTPATNQYLPAAGSGFTKTKLKGRVDWSALDSFNCTSGTADPISWLDLVDNGGFIVKNA